MVKLIAKHGDYTIEVEGKDPKEVLIKYQKMLVLLQIQMKGERTN